MLQEVADHFGCRVIYDAVGDRVIVTKIGVGNNLPDGSVRRYGPKVTSVAMPDRIAVMGAPSVFQGRFFLEPVGEDWNGEYLPIDALSYAPRLPGKVHKVLLHLGANQPHDADYQLARPC